MSGPKRHWTSLEAYEGRAPDHEGEFSPEVSAEITRRGFVQLLGGGAALAAVACTQPPRERILPYAQRPPEVQPGIPQHYATIMSVDGYATGMVVASHTGRPTKVEGNVSHPASLGGSGVREQASVFQLYDPERARAINRGRGQPGSWRSVVERLRQAAVANGGQGLRVLMEPTSAPHVVALLERLSRDLPESRVTYFAPLARANAWEGAARAFGQVVETIYDFTRVDVVLSLDADFLTSGPFAARWARQVGLRRRFGVDRPIRLYAVEGHYTPTGSLADHRLRVRAGDVGHVAKAVLGEVLRATAGAAPTWHSAAGRDWEAQVARDLVALRGRAVVLAGDRQPPEVHVLAHALNSALAAPVGATAEPTFQLVRSPVRDAGEPSHDLAPLVEEMRGGDVKTLLILGVNPVYAAPADLDFASALERVPLSLHLGLYEDETSPLCTDFVPAAHFLEAWGDGRALDGTAAIQQPLIEPLHGGRTAAEILGALLGDARDPYTMVWETSRQAGLGWAWEQSLHDGVVKDSAFAPVAGGFRPSALDDAVGRIRSATQGLELSLVESATLYDGRFANCPWLLELPDPMTKLTWDNAALISPKTARAQGIESGDVLELTVGERSARAPAYVFPGHADDAITLALGWGRDGSEAHARGVGANGYALRHAATPWTAPLLIKNTHDHHKLARSQTHDTLEGRPHVLKTSDPAAVAELTRTARGEVMSLMGKVPGEGPEYERRPEIGGGHQWGMAIELGACNGCSACVMACVTENNTPVVGKTNVLKSREMHWLRIDRYFVGEPDDAEVVNQPMLCQHCEKAPCEYVCPVNATVHSADGLNEMVYNRCIGTRFCSNNCPYKVRRFNWFDFVNRSLVQLQKNPNVTVRERGVMEKCTFCVQRIRSAGIEARVEGRPLVEDDVKTACQQACPTNAIVFGDLSDPDSAVSVLTRKLAAYEVLHDQGTKPRVRYLVRVDHTNPALEGHGNGEGGEH